MIQDVANFVTIKTEEGDYSEFSPLTLEGAAGVGYDSSSSMQDAYDFYPQQLPTLTSPLRELFSPQTEQYFLPLELASSGMDQAQHQEQKLHKSTPAANSSSTVQQRRALTLATGRRDLKSERVGPEEARRRAARRESNRRAAAKCRLRRQNCIDTLEEEIDGLEDERQASEEDIKRLQAEVHQLQDLLERHTISCSLTHNAGTALQSSPASSMQHRRPDSLPMKLSPNDDFFLEEVSLDCSGLTPLLATLDTPKSQFAMEMDEFSWSELKPSL